MNKRTVLTTTVTSLLIIAPIVFGLLTNMVPDKINLQILFYVFPVALASINIWIGYKTKESTYHLSVFSMWLLAISSWGLCWTLMSREVDALSIHTIFPLLSGILFFLIGNYLPKQPVDKEHMTPLAIMTPWLYVTINKEKNTSIQAMRFAAKIWVVGGILLMFTVLFQNIAFLYVDTIILLLLFMVPTIYAWVRFHKTPAQSEV